MSKIQLIKDFPSQGVNFRHIGPLLKDHEAFEEAMNHLYNLLPPRIINSVDVVAGLDARGFILATWFAQKLKVGQVMIRKKSKLPGEKYSTEYSLEYGQNCLELEHGVISEGQKVLLVDDLLATGGSLKAATYLVEQAKGVVDSYCCLVEITDLKGRELLDSSKVFTLYEYLTTSGEEPERVNIPFKQFRPVNPYQFTGLPLYDTNNVLMWYPTMEYLADTLLSEDIRPSFIDWKKFKDGWPDIVFESSKTLADKNVYFLMDVSKPEYFMEQLAILIALPRQLIGRLEVIIPYMGPGTHERVDYSGMLATAEPLMKMLSGIPHTKNGPCIVRIFDIHALPIRFYNNDNIIVKLNSIIPILNKEKYIKDKTIVFPDDGAYKRFKYNFTSNPIIVCSKIRDGDKRSISIKERYNWPKNYDIEKTTAIIVDDLVQTGGTMIECAKALKDMGYKTIEAYATHAIFPNKSWKKFENSPISKFYITNTTPIGESLSETEPFHVINCGERIVKEIGIETRDKNRCLNVFVGSENKSKLNAVYAFFNRYRAYVKVYSTSTKSGVHEQPIGVEETNTGASNRLKDLLKQRQRQGWDFYITVENGIYKRRDVRYSDNNDRWFDSCSIATHEKTSSLDCIKWNDVDITKYIGLYSQDQNKTFGSEIEEYYGFKKGTWHERLTQRPREYYIYNAMVDLFYNLKFGYYEKNIRN